VTKKFSSDSHAAVEKLIATALDIISGIPEDNI